MACACAIGIPNWAGCGGKRVSNVERKDFLPDGGSRKSESIRTRSQKDDLDEVFGFTLRKQRQPAETHFATARCSDGVTERKVMLSATRLCQKVKVRMKLNRQIQSGEHHAISGSNESFGAWKESVMMGWTEAGWVVDLEVEPGEKIEFKYITLTRGGNVVWEEGANRVLIIPDDCCEHYQVNSHWSETQEKLDFEVIRQNPELECRSSATEEERGQAAGASQSRIRLGKEGSKDYIPIKQQEETVFMRLNERSGEGMAKWDNYGLDTPVGYIGQGDSRCPSWWLKLDLVRNLLVGDVGKTERLESLASSAIYLKWIQTGHIPCSQGDGIQPKNKPGVISRYIFRELERILSGKLVSPKEVIMVTKVHPLLPVFRAGLMDSKSLVSLQDVANRNDVPHDIKSDLDKFITSQLLWASGPESLAIAEALQHRIHNFPGEPNRELVDQFKVFYADLRDFHNAGSLEERLDPLQHSFDERNKAVLEHFLDSKQVLDATSEARSRNSVEGAEFLIEALHALTRLRAVLTKGLESGLRNDAPNEAIAMRQKWRLADIELEDYASVLLSRYEVDLENKGGPNFLSTEARVANIFVWNQPLQVLALGIRQLGLSGWDQRECLAIENELIAWQAGGITPYEGIEETRLWAQRLEVTLERSHRLLKIYADTVRELYFSQAEKLGAALGISEKAVNEYFDPEFQSSVVSKLSSIISVLLTAARDLSGSAECAGYVRFAG